MYPAQSEITSTTEIIFGGTFDPPHQGHLSLIQQLLDTYSPQVIRLIPCALPVLKASAAATFEHRQQMLRLNLQELSNATDIDRVIIDNREARRKKPSYSLETLQDLTAEMPQKSWIWVMGTDAAVDLDKWWNWLRLKDYCHLLIFNRPGYSCDAAAKSASAAGFGAIENLADSDSKTGKFQLWRNFSEPVSSSLVRNAIKENQLTDGLLSSSVIKYIRQHQLYQ